MEKVIQYAEKNFNQFVEKLKTLVRIPSISLSVYPKEEVEKSAKAVASLLKEEGLENVEIINYPGSLPYVYADWLHAPGKPTVLLYAHHDVQPPGKEENWKTPVFEPTEINGRLFARGAADDKAGIIVHSSAIGSYLKTVGKLPINVKLIIEGEEEIGSGNLGNFLEKYKEKLKCDMMVLTDTANFDVGVPSITTSLRGLVAVEVEVHSLKQSVHSGMWGGAIPDPVIALSKIISSLVDENGKILIPGIYNDVKEMTPNEEKSLESLNYSNLEYQKQAGILPNVEILGDESISPLKKMWRLPSISINAIEASSRKRVSNIINESVWCKIGIRTVPNMNAEKTLQALITHLKKNAPWGVEVKIKPEETGPWWITNSQGPAFDKAQKALSKAFNNGCVFIGAGGSIPFVNTMTQVLGDMPALLIGVEDPYTNAHSENESVHLGDLKKSILGAVYLYEALAE